jgi:Uma2 family endonuclease
VSMGEPVSALPSQVIVREPMSYDEFLALPEHIRAEYVDGVALMTPPPTRGHDRVQLRLAMLLHGAFADVDVATTPGIQVTPSRMRIPDLAIFETFEDVSITDQIPLLVVEILSPSTRSEDTIRKLEEYRLAGIVNYWIVDRDNRTLSALINEGSRWHTSAELTDHAPSGIVSVESLGEIELDLAALLDG